MKLRQQSSSAYHIPFLMISSSNHVDGVIGLSPSCWISKNGSAFATASGAIAETGSGWYSYGAHANDRNTLGSLGIHIAASAGADPYDDLYTIVPFDPFDAVRLGLTALPNADALTANGIPTASGIWVYDTRTLSTSAIAASTFAASAIDTNAYALNAASKIWDVAVRSASADVTMVNGASVALSSSVAAGLTGSALTEISASVSTASGVWTYGTRVITGMPGSIIAASSITDDVVTAIQGGLANETDVADAVWSSSLRALTDKVNFGLSASAVDEIWDEPKSAHTTASTFGDYLDKEITAITGTGATAEEVWTYSTRVLSASAIAASTIAASAIYATAIAASAINNFNLAVTAGSQVWNAAVRVITGGSVVATSGSVVTTSNLDKSSYVLAASSIGPSTIAASTINDGTFALTAGSQVWNAAVRTITGGTVTSGSVVATSGSVVVTSVLDKTNYVLAASSIGPSTIAASTISDGTFALTAASQIWNAAVRTITGGSVVATSGSVTALTVIDKTDYGLSASAVDDIWNEPQIGHTTACTFGYYVDAQISESGGSSAGATAQEVWEYGTRTITGGSVIATSGSVITISNLDKTGYVLAASSIAASTLAASAITENILTDRAASAVWNSAVKIITGGSVVATSGSVVTTSNLDKIGYALAASSIAASTLAASAITEGVFSATAGSVVWNAAVRIITGGSVVATSGSVTTITNLDKTNYGLSASAVDEVWDESQDGHTSVCTFGYYLDSRVSDAGGSSAGATAQEVWEYAARTITGGSVIATSGSVTVISNLDKTNYGLSGSALEEISGSLSEAGAAASDVWAYGTRALTDKVNFGLSTSALDEISASVATPQEVWEYATRALTDKVNFGLSASAVDEVWDEPKAGHTTASTFGKYLDQEITAVAAGTGATAQEVWEYATRTITGGSVIATSGSVIVTSGSITATNLDTNITSIKSVTDKLDTALELDGVVYRYTLNALERAPTGGTVAGSGSETVTLTITHNLLPVNGAAVWASTDVAGANVVAGTLYSNMSGQVTFYLDTGSYYVWVTKSGIDFNNPNAITVS